MFWGFFEPDVSSLKFKSYGTSEYCNVTSLWPGGTCHATPIPPTLRAPLFPSSRIREGRRPEQVHYNGLWCSEWQKRQEVVSGDMR